MEIGRFKPAVRVRMQTKVDILLNDTRLGP